MTSKERVKRAVRFQGADKIPVYFFNKDVERSDIIVCPVGGAADFRPLEPGMDEWGVVWRHLDGTMGQPGNHIINDDADFDGFRAPDPDDPARYSHIPEFIKRNQSKYIMSGLGITGFNRVTFLRGFENTMDDLYNNKARLDSLLDKVFGFETRVIERLCRYDIDAVTFYDDWGTQNALMISPAMWRETFYPRYKKQFDVVRSMGKDVYFHSCGYTFDIIAPLIECGAAIFNFNQPDCNGVEKMAENFAGKACFNLPADLQTVAVKGTKKDIYDYTANLARSFWRRGGGFIGYVEAYSSIGLSDENYKHCADALEYANSIAGDAK
jgi:hypothetical protein